MASNKTTDQLKSNDKQPHRERTHDQEAHDTTGQRPNGERTMQPSNKAKQKPEEDHSVDEKSNRELADERGGHGHSGHSGNRNGSRKKQ